MLPNSIQKTTMFNIKIRQKMSMEKAQQNTQNVRCRILENSKNRQHPHRMSLSLNQINKEIEPLRRATISTEITPVSKQKTSKNGINYSLLSKKLNFRAVNLEPMKTHQQSSAGNLPPMEDTQSQKQEKEIISPLKLKTKNHRKLKFLESRTDKSSENDVRQTIDRDSMEKGERKSRGKVSIPASPNKLALILSKRKYRKFEFEDDLSSGLSDDSSAELSFMSQLSERKRQQSRKSQHQEKLIDENELFQNRKRKITQVEEDSQNKESTNRNTTKHVDNAEPSNDDLEDLNKHIQTTTAQEVDDDQNDQDLNDDQKGFDNLINSIKNIYSQVVPEQQQSLKPEVQCQSDKNQDKLTSIISNDPIPPPITPSAPKKKIIMKACKLLLSQLPHYFTLHTLPTPSPLLSQIQTHQHYICEFYINEVIFNIIVFCPSVGFDAVEIRVIHEVKSGEVDGLLQEDSVKDKFRKVVMRNFVEIVKKATEGGSFCEIRVLVGGDSRGDSCEQQYSWLSDCGFILNSDNHFTYPLTNPSSKPKPSKQFLSISGSILSIPQSVNESLLYSDEISPFRGGKYDVSEKVFCLQETFGLMPTETFVDGRFDNMEQVNGLLQQKELDTFEINEDTESMIFPSLQPKAAQHTTPSHTKLLTFCLNQHINRHFIISNGWLKTTTSLIFHQKSQKICQLPLSPQHSMYMGKGFQHIVTMKNKITHYKTRMSSTKHLESSTRTYPTKIRMFSKQLYGLIRHQNGTAFYGNWEMGFSYRHELLGKVGYEVDTQGSEDKVVFGNSTFFVTLYKGDQFVLGWEVEENDFLY